MRQAASIGLSSSACPPLQWKKKETELEDLKIFLCHLFLLIEVHKEENSGFLLLILRLTQ